MNARRNPGGLVRGRSFRTQISLTPSMTRELRKIALEYKCSFAEAVRIVLTWGLESR